MIATHRLWRYLPGGSLEVTEPGERCDWIDERHVYFHLGWAVVEDEEQPKQG